MMRRALIGLIRAYQAIGVPIMQSPVFLGGVSGCRSWPTCSEFAVQAIERDGAWKGSARAVARIAKCNPLWPSQSHG
jgi:putative membrane protein insertion efficiency factor